MAGYGSQFFTMTFILIITFFHWVLSERAEGISTFEEAAEGVFALPSTVFPSPAKGHQRLDYQTRDRHDRETVLLLRLQHWLYVPFEEASMNSLGDCVPVGNFGVACLFVIGDGEFTRKLNVLF